MDPTWTTRYFALGLSCSPHIIHTYSALTTPHYMLSVVLPEIRSEGIFTVKIADESEREAYYPDIRICLGNAWVAAFSVFWDYVGYRYRDHLNHRIDKGSWFDQVSRISRLSSLLSFMNRMLIELGFSMSVREGYLYWRNRDTVLTAPLLLKYATIQRGTSLTIASLVFASLEPTLQIGSQVFSDEKEFLQSFHKEVTLLLSHNVS